MSKNDAEYSTDDAEDTNLKLRRIEDEFDEMYQQSLKGNFIVTSKATDDKDCIIIDDYRLGDNQTLLSHIRDLVLLKLGVELSDSDVACCQRLEDASVLLRLWNRKQGSPYQSMVRAIKDFTNPQVNVFFNFRMTPRRNRLFYEVRKMKKDKDISKFYTDEHGNIKIVLDGDEKKKIRLTGVKSEEYPSVKTFTVLELKQLVSCQNDMRRTKEKEERLLRFGPREYLI